MDTTIGTRRVPARTAGIDRKHAVGRSVARMRRIAAGIRSTPRYDDQLQEWLDAIASRPRRFDDPRGF